jgi:molybdenum cofactor synthesis domain-containing protein
LSLIPLAEAQHHVLGQCPALPAEVVSIEHCLGRVLAETITAGEAVPPFANTAMDGYAVRADDTAGAPVTLDVVGTLAAGARPDVEVGPGQAVRIMTGAPIPPGADAVVMVEVTKASPDGSSVVIERAATAGDHVRPAGEDLASGQEVFSAGTELRPGHLGVLASAGVTQVRVGRRPRVGVLSTGDELVDDDRALEPGQIRDSNRHTLLGLIADAGFEPVDLGIARDDDAVIEACFRRGVETCDAVVTSGGVSVGDFDYVKVVLDRLSGGTFRWMQIAIKPAKPFAFGTIGGVPVFGLPGNPVSSMVSFELLARPALRQMAGHTDLHRPAVTATASEPLRRQPDGKTHFARVTVVYEWGRFWVRSSGGQASNLLRSMALANALAVLPDGEGAATGDEVAVLLLTWP